MELFKFLSDSEKVGSIIFYPPKYDKSSVAAAVQSQKNFSGKGFLLMTENQGEFKKNHAYPDNFFPDSIFVSYQKPTAKRNNMLKVGLTNDVYIIIDDLAKLVNKKMLPTFKKMNPNTRLIILADYKTTKADYAAVIKNFTVKGKSQLQTLFTNFCEYPKLEISYDVVRVQQKYLDSSPNFIYPEMGKRSFDWMREDILYRLPQHSKKFRALLSEIMTEIPKKRLIILGEKDIHLLSKLMDFCAIDHDKITKEAGFPAPKITAFNEESEKKGKSILLVSPIHSRFLYRGVEVFHILDDFKITTLNTIIDNCVKVRNYKNGGNVVFKYYCGEDQAKIYDAAIAKTIAMQNEFLSGLECKSLHTNGVEGLKVI